MTSKNFSRRWLAVAALVGFSGASQAALTVYTTEASFLAAVTAPGLDTFDNLTPGPIPGPIPDPDIPGEFLIATTVSRTAGPAAAPFTGTYAYTASASAGLYGTGLAGDGWLSTFAAVDHIVIDFKAAGVRAAGANFFVTAIDGSFKAGLWDIQLVATDGGASSTQVITGLSSSTASFLGFVSTVPLNSLVVSVLNNPAGVVTDDQLGWPTVNNLILASVPEPETYALLLAGLAVVGFMARRRRA